MSHAVRTARRRGAISYFLVLGMMASIAVLVGATDAELAPFLKEQRRRTASQEALALAEAGVELGLAELARSPAAASLADVRLGRGTIDVRLDAAEGGVVTLTSSGRAPATLVGPGVLTRRLRVRVKVETGAAPRVVAREEL